MSFSLRNLFSRGNQDMPPIGQNVAVYLDDKRILVCADHYTAGRMSGPGEPYEWLNLNVAAGLLGDTIQKCLEHSMSNMMDKERIASTEAMCKIASTKSLDGFSRQWQYVSVHRGEDSENPVTVMPWRSSVQGGYTRLNSDPTYTCPDDAAIIGKAVLNASREMTRDFVDDETLEIHERD